MGRGGGYQDRGVAAHALTISEAQPKAVSWRSMWAVVKPRCTIRFSAHLEGRTAMSKKLLIALTSHHRKAPPGQPMGADLPEPAHPHASARSVAGEGVDSGRPTRVALGALLLAFAAACSHSPSATTDVGSATDAAALAEGTVPSADGVPLYFRTAGARRARGRARPLPGL